MDVFIPRLAVSMEATDKWITVVIRLNLAECCSHWRPHGRSSCLVAVVTRPPALQPAPFTVDGGVAGCAWASSGPWRGLERLPTEKRRFATSESAAVSSLQHTESLSLTIETEKPRNSNSFRKNKTKQKTTISHKATTVKRDGICGKECEIVIFHAYLASLDYTHTNAHIGLWLGYFAMSLRVQATHCVDKSRTFNGKWELHELLAGSRIQLTGWQLLIPTTNALCEDRPSCAWVDVYTNWVGHIAKSFHCFLSLLVAWGKINVYA